MGVLRLLDNMHGMVRAIGVGQVEIVNKGRRKTKNEKRN